MNVVKTFFSSVVHSFEYFKRKKLYELMYFSYSASKQLYYQPNILLFSSIILLILSLINTDSIVFILLLWLLTGYVIAFLRPSIDLKNYKYFFNNLLGAGKLLSIFLLIFYIPYSILNSRFLPSDSVIIGIFFTLLGLFSPFKFSSVKIGEAVILSIVSLVAFLGFKSLIYHYLLMGYLHSETIITWLLPIFMLDKHLYSLIGVASFIFSPLTIFAFLSILDSRKTFNCQVKGIGRGVKIFFLTYPLNFVCFHLFRFLLLGIPSFFRVGLFSNVLLMIWFFFLYYCYLAFLTNVYVEKVHEQF